MLTLHLHWTGHDSGLARLVKCSEADCNRVRSWSPTTRESGRKASEQPGHAPQPRDVTAAQVLQKEPGPAYMEVWDPAK